MRRLCILALSIACSAPDVEEAPDRGPSPSPAELRAEAETREGAPETEAPPAASVPPPTTAVPSPAPATPALPVEEPPSIEPATEAELPPPPFTAWTTQAPLSLASESGSPVSTLKNLGVRVEVLEVGPERIKIRCSGCVGDARDAEGWIEPGVLKSARNPGGGRDPLGVMLTLRAAWAGGKELPAGATNAALCALVDHGFTLSDGVATWSLAEGVATLSWTGERWELGPVRAPALDKPWTCRTDGRAQPTGKAAGKADGKAQEPR